MVVLTIRSSYDTDYLTDAVAKGREGYYTGAVAAGEPPGRWHGAGAELLGLTGEVDAEVMKALYTHGLDPRDPNTARRETWGKAARLGNAPRNYRKAEEIYAGLLEAHPQAGPEKRAELRAQAAGSARQSVAFYDITLSAPKSMTVLWVGCERAASDAHADGAEDEAGEWRAAAAAVEEALMVGHRAALDFLAEKAGYARRGHHGGGAGEWVDAHRFVAAQFLQHDSRDHDPHLHVHGAVANKVPCADGKWLAVDSNLLKQWRWAAAAVGERVAEAHLTETLGARWVTRPDGAREVAGVDADSTGMFSKRSKAITPRMEQLLAQFRREVGRDPVASERSRLHDEAFQSTRAGKVFGGETREGQIARWADEHAQQLGVHLGDVARRVLAQGGGEADAWSERDVIARALAAVEEAKQSWTRADLMFAISQALPGQLGIRHDQVPVLLDGLAEKALTLARHLNPHEGPAGLEARFYRADGSSTFVRPGSERFATDAQLLGEAELRAAAVRRGAPAWTSEQAAEVVDRFAHSGRALGEDQATALTGILTSGAAVEVLAAPAGTGKSFLVGALAETWPTTGRPVGGPDGSPEPDGGARGGAEGPRVFGLAYGQRQADVLTEEGVTARNIRRWLDGQARLDAGHPADGDEAFRLRSGDLLVVDEAGAAPTADLVAIHRRAAAVGAKLLLVGDSRQLAAVGAGGSLADVAAAGITYELAEVRRFRNEWEGPASLRLRDGDAGVVGEYAKHGRIVDAGTPEQAEQAAARAWLADTIDGRDALLVVGSNEAAARVSAGLRAELVRLGKVQEDGVLLGMPGWAGTAAGVGDLIQARRNAWHLKGWEGNTQAPVNRTTYRVMAVRPDGGLTVAPVTGRDPVTADGSRAEQLGDPMQLPPAYVREHVTLAYASTVHAAHGRTVDVGHAVLGAGADAASAYVQLTRGREGNTAFVITRNVAGEAATGETHSIAARDAATVLGDAIRPADVDPNRTALTEAEHAAERARSTMTQVDPMIAVIGEDLTGRTGSLLDRLAAEGTLPEHHRVALAADEARGTLDGLLRTAELAGHDPEQVLRDAVTATPLDGATSVAQVLHFRIRTALDGKLEPQVDGYADLIPHAIRRDTDHPSAAGLAALAAAADVRRSELGAQLAADPPQWTREALGPVPDPACDPAGRAEWERRAGWAGSYRELVDHTDHADPLGAAPPAGLVEKHAVFRAAHQALDLPDAGADEEQMSEGRLRARVVAARREEVWAPRYVADELDATHEALRTARADATIWAARAAAEADPHEAAQLRAAANNAQERADQLAEQVDALTAADDARSLWLIETAVTRDRAERARQALSWRGIDVDSPDDRVTAQEWLDADHAAKLAADPDRPITEHDLAPDDLTHADQAHDNDTDQGVTDHSRTDGEPALPERDDDAVDEQGRADDDPVADDRAADDRAADDGAADDGAVDDRTAPAAHDVDVPDVDVPTVEVPEVELPEVGVLDIRDATTPDAGEWIDPQQRRRVPLPDETAVTVDRARLGVAEIEARRAAEAAALDDDPEPVDDLAPLDGFDPEDERRNDLIRWADDRDGRDDGHASGRSEEDDGEALGR
ncbi:MobF family relaxase [Pseudonocardia nigra]|uniref:MobF family relaxase n=1 Tax=Pseudonocardia nigra TaxID=1921578 RepID=UPI001FEAEBC0|nr:MobF family relaxase [Pseudonocardia nigra]